MIPLWARVVAVLAVLGSAYWWIDRTGYQRGVSVTAARHAAQVAVMQRDLDAARQSDLQSSLDLENWRDATRILTQEVDRETLADADRCVPTAIELQRAKRRWGVPN